MGSETNVPEDNYIKTANKTGVMTKYLDQIARAGIEFSNGKKQPILEVGCANGYVSIPLLEQGNMVIANDTSAHHLAQLKSSAPSESVPNLTLAEGAFPELPELKTSSLSAVISVWVFHFLSGEELEVAAAKLYEALEPGGKVFLSVSSPYVKFLGSFIEEYEERVALGAAYPGWMADVSLYLSAHQVENLPKAMHFLDPVVLKRVFVEAGFSIEFAEFFKRADVTEGMFLDGRENVGLIAVKPT